MELCFMKGRALDTLKGGLKETARNYLREPDNKWLGEICGENPFVKFRDVPDFELAPLDGDLTAGEIEFRNCKILYSRLGFLTARQAADERFWAGLCHGVFYGYIRRRYGYDTAAAHPKAADEIKTRFFFETLSRTGLFRNTLAKCWWTRRAFFDKTRDNAFEKLDILGAGDISSKISYILRYPFTSNPKILNGIVKFFKHFRDANKSLGALKESLRPAMYELNKRGGATILDCLSEDEIAAIMIERVEKSFAEKVPVVAKLPVIVNVPVGTKISTAANVPVDDKRKVKHDSEIIAVSLDNGRKRNYKMTGLFKRKFPDIYDELIGKKLNSVVTIKDKKFTITEIQ